MSILLSRATRLPNGLFSRSISLCLNGHQSPAGGHCCAILAPMATDPFVNVHRNASQFVRDFARHCYAQTRSAFPQFWVGRGWDPKSSEHGTGRALDGITSAKVGQVSTGVRLAKGNIMVAWMQKHAVELHIRHIIWQNKIWKTRYAKQGWVTLTENGGKPRKGVSNRHEDHWHVMFQDTKGRIPREPIFGGVAPLPTIPVTAPVSMIPRVIHAKPYPALVVDGIFGSKSFARLEMQLSLALSGKAAWTHYSVRALKLWVRRPDRGVAVLLSEDVRSLQARVGARVDGVLGKETYGKLQAFLNANRT